MSDFPSAGTPVFQALDTEKQEKVFDAAVGEFASKGYRNASMNSLVKTAGISKGSLFAYFKTKCDLFHGVLEIATLRVKSHLKQFRDRTADLDFFNRLETLARAGFVFIDEHPLMARIYFHLLQSGEAPFGAERVLELRREGDEFVANLVREAVARGELRPDLDIPRVAFLINTVMERLLQGYYTEFLASGLGLYRGDPEELDQWIKATIDLFRHGLAK
jgi:TetR/AcrR family transcriptional regulator